MNLGDLVEYTGIRWQVYRADRNTRTVTLLNWSGVIEEVPDDTPDVKVVVSPSSQWPFLVAPIRSQAGPPIKLSRPFRGRSGELEPLVDWVPSDPKRAGGSIFMNPALGLRLGEILTVEYTSGVKGRIKVTRSFKTIAQRTRPKPSPSTPEEILLSGDFMGND